jgi:hypothetical protein
MPSGVRALRLQQPNEFAATTANVCYAADHGRQQGTDVTPMPKSSWLVLSAVGVL